jgi:hypothetical protein
MFTGVPCEDGASTVSNLCLTDAEGKQTRMLTFDQESNWHPCVLNNGRVLYTRYEYANISHQFGRLLFHMNPDGTGQAEYYGSNSYWPNSIFHARPIPDHPTMVIGVVCGHHGPNKTGRLVLFDPALGRQETSGAVQTIPGWGQPVERIVEDVLYGDAWPKFVHPWPLSDKYFLVSARLHPEQDDYAIYLVAHHAADRGAMGVGLPRRHGNTHVVRGCRRRLLHGREPGRQRAAAVRLPSQTQMVPAGRPLRRRCVGYDDGRFVPSQPLGPVRHARERERMDAECL